MIETKPKRRPKKSLPDPSAKLLSLCERLLLACEDVKSILKAGCYDGDQPVETWRRTVWFGRQEFDRLEAEWRKAK